MLWVLLRLGQTLTDPDKGARSFFSARRGEPGGAPGWLGTK